MNPEIVINICEDKLQFDKNTKRNFRQYIRKNNQKHLLTQLAYQYADFVMNNNNTQNIGEIKQDLPVIQVDHQLQEKYDNLLKENEKLKETIKSHKTNKELEEKYEKLQKSKDRIRKQYIEQINELEKQVSDYKSKYEKEDTIINTDDVSSLKKLINTLKIDNQDLKTKLSIKEQSVLESDDDDDIEELRKENKQLRLDMSIAKRIPDFKNQLLKQKKRYYKETEARKKAPIVNDRVDPLDEEFDKH
tara:strand:+ start:182 stop:922 length:741 start_codon:yes stop_codon:yes gene_type:complete